MSEFDERKELGTTAEIALQRLLTNAGAVVLLNQQNRDATNAEPGAAIAHASMGRMHHLPDLSIYWPARNVMPRHGIEAKAKSPLRRGGWGWDRKAFDRAWRWSQISGDPVVYAIRNLSDAPLPPLDELDDPDLWWIASVWKLHHSPQRSSDDHHHYWPSDDFVPLRLLLDGHHLAAATVPYVPMTGGPPMML